MGVFAGIEYDVLRLRTLVSPAPRRLTPYGGLVAKEKREEIVPVLWRTLMSALLKEYVVIVVTDPPTAEWICSSHHEVARKTLTVDLTQPTNILWSRLRKGRRYDIRKAERKGVSVVEGTTETQVEAYYDLLKHTLQRKEFTILPPVDFYKDVFRTLRPSRARLLLAMHRDRTVAGSFLLNDDRHLYYWSGASNEDGLALGANSMIQWRTILWGKENALHEYDMTGANIPSVSFFKAGFGGEYRQYYTHVIAKPSSLGHLVARLISTIH
jgi:lipid II:glycine glycyltransferase (peptidoglycan interpeptide bridge formation enzyme)